ncbi:phytanoyl-CoA dioxygenase family protein [Pelagibius sp.]|uniref:phytanoyl-CoA dioxygenase family protein n=1 Tax=Pelagibius sp. TaxID=1931238 RepID=UPI00260B3D96|nr:phytanoyl-CoA dioxygenase family protein [Pelagibius sp.]
MTAEDLRKAFKRDGYVLLRGALSAQEVAEIRATLPPVYDKLTLTPKRYMQARECLAVPPVYRLMAHPKIIEACRRILGEDLVYVNDLVVQRNVIPVGDNPPHLDCQAEFRFNRDSRYLVDPNFLFAKVGVYLQDNTEDYAGGIDIYPRGHRWVGNGLFFSYQFYKRVLRRMFDRGMKLLDTKAGDVLIFDSRLPHRSTAATKLGQNNYQDSDDGAAEVPEERAKYVVYWEVARQGDEVHFVACNKARARKEEMKRPVGAYRPRCSYLGLVYPDDYPPELVEKLDVEGVKVFSLTREEADPWLAAFKEGAGEALAAESDGKAVPPQ